MPARHDILVRRARLPLAAVGIDRGVGGRHHPIAAGPGRDHHAGLGPSAPVRGGRRELPHRLRRLGLRARPRERSVAHRGGPVLGGHAHRDAVGPRPARAHAYDRSRTWFRSEEDFPGPRTMAEAARWIRQEAPAHDRFFLMVDEFDPHEPFDTPAPFASMYDPDWDGPDRDLAALPGRRGGQRSARRAHRPSHPGQLRLEADLHRPLVRPAARRAGRDRPGPVDRRDPVHRPRPLPGRARPVRQARRPDLQPDGPHPDARALARSGATGHRRADHLGRPPRHHRRRVRRVGRAPHPRHARCSRCWTGPPTRCASWPCSATGVARWASPTAGGATCAAAATATSPVDVVEPVVDDADPRLPRRPAAPTRSPGHPRDDARDRRPGHPPALRRGRPPAVLGRRPHRRARPCSSTPSSIPTSSRTAPRTRSGSGPRHGRPRRARAGRRAGRRAAPHRGAPRAARSGSSWRDLRCG